MGGHLFLGGAPGGLRLGGGLLQGRVFPLFSWRRHKYFKVGDGFVLQSLLQRVTVIDLIVGLGQDAVEVFQVIGDLDGRSHL